ncbi:Smr/MutS family protein [Cardinium endosymbiont of Nabis limbatus]|uniref:Smr/MutS family protein n=1 Tax=Cardinium endosymbiont of Nabis limbatus TaxID=3066217 RepID=UPI003AF3C8E0
MPIPIGSYVRIKNQKAIGQVVAIELHKLLIAVGKLHLYLPLQAVEVVEAPLPIQTKGIQAKGIAVRAPYTVADPILDLHGFNKTQALPVVEKFLDHSLLLGHSRLKIIHGQGKGILRSAIRSYLKAHPFVKKVILQSPIYCMNGMTIVEI